VVQVDDSAGQAKAGVQVTPSVDLSPLLTRATAIVQRRQPAQWVQVLTPDSRENPDWHRSARVLDAGNARGPLRPNEDLNRNGVREAGAFVPGATAPSLASRQKT
jgi:hypothetical protein